MRVRNASKSVKEWTDVFARKDSSELPIENFCKEEGISLTCYYKHRKRLESKPDSKFIEVNLAKREVPKTRVIFELRFSNWELTFNLGGR